MEKIKEKIDHLKIESENNLKRAVKAEQEVEQTKAELEKRQTLIKSLENKVSMLSESLKRSELKMEEVFSYLL